MFRRLTLVLVLAGLGLATWGAQTSTACSLAGPPPPLHERLAAAAGAFVGTVISRRDTPPGPSGSIGSGDPTVLRFAVERAYKGDLGSEVDVMTVRSSATCGLEAQPGDRLALLLRTDAHGRWTAGLGDNVDLAQLEDAARARLSLRAVPARDLRVRVTASRAGTATLIARVAGLRIRRTLRFAAPGTRTARLIPVARSDRRRLTAARRRPGPLHATVTATMGSARASTRTTLA